MGKHSLLGSDLVDKTLEKVHIIRNHLQMGYSSQKFYANHRIRDLEFVEGDKVFLKFSPMKGVVRFRKKGKLRSNYVGPYESLQRIGKVANELNLDSKLVYFIMLSICLCSKGDPEHILPNEGLAVKDNLSY